MGERGRGPYVLTEGPCSCYFMSWYLLIKVTKDELTHMTHKEMHIFEIYTFVCQINHKVQNIK